MVEYEQAARFLRSLAYLHLQRQEWQQAVALLDEAITILSETDNHCEYLWFLGAYRAEVYLGLGRLTDALECITEYLALARQSESRYFEGLALRVQAHILAAGHHHAAAIDAADQAIAALEATDTRLELGRVFYQRALMRGQLNQARPSASICSERASCLAPAARSATSSLPRVLQR